MSLDFDFGTVRTVEFGVGKDQGPNPAFVAVPVDDTVQGALVEMAQTTWLSYDSQVEELSEYEPSERYSSGQVVHLSTSHGLATGIAPLHRAANLSMSAGVLRDPTSIFCYFARLVDARGRRLTALRRATQFKGVLKNRLIRFSSDALRLIPDNVFKLDADFDLLMDDITIHVLHPSGFEFMGRLQEAILAAVPTTIRAISKRLTYVDFDNVEAYASTHPRAARYLASIHSQGVVEKIDRGALKRLCKTTGVEIATRNGKIRVEDDHIPGVLEVLDRRRYQIELVRGSPESFRAASRRRLRV